MYRVLARKWRPQTFAEVVGQDAVVQTLTNAIASGRIHHAYLFTGLRGVGKTTLARILAKALNCVSGPTAAPCGNCDPCREITEGTALDVREIDAASNTGVDDVRELIENIRYSPSRDRYKVYIVDEVHMLSTAAFNALLKTLEEPPPYGIFVLATTELGKVPATVVSRTQQFDFRRLELPTLGAHLRTIVTAEQVQVSDAGLEMIAAAAGGSLRDAITLLDQAISFAGNELSEEALAALLGVPDFELLAGLLGAVAAPAPLTIVELVGVAEAQGLDLARLYAAIVEFSHRLLMLRIGRSAGVPAPELAAMTSLANAFPYENLLRLAHLLLEAETMVKRGEAPRIALELVLLRAAELPKLSALEDVLAAGAGPLAARAVPPLPAVTSPALMAPAATAAAVATPVAAAPRSDGRGKTPVSAPLPEGRGKTPVSAPLPEGRGKTAVSAPLPEGRGKMAVSAPLPEGRGKTAVSAPWINRLPREAEAAVQEMPPFPPLPPLDAVLADHSDRADRGGDPLSTAAASGGEALLGSEVEDFLRRLALARGSAAGEIVAAASLSVLGGALRIGFTSDQGSLRQRLEDPEERRGLETAAREVWPGVGRVELIHATPPDGDLGTLAANEDKGELDAHYLRSKALSDPVVQKAMELFKGEITDIKKGE